MKQRKKSLSLKEYKRQRLLRTLGSVLSVVLLLLGLYLYNCRIRHIGFMQFGTALPDPDTLAAVHFIDVGQADAACAVLPGGEVLLVDAGSNASEDQLLSYLARYGIKKIDIAVFTHPHEDHIGGADAVFDACDIKSVLLSDAVAATSTFDILTDCIADEGCTVQYAVPGDTYSLGDACLTVLGPAMQDEENLNNESILLHLQYGDTSFLFTGDAEEPAETAAVLRAPDALKADVLKVGHHGSSTSSCEAFLDAVRPKVAVISCGTYNEYGHPHAAAVERLQAFTEHIFRTDRLGAIRVYSDGETLYVQSERTETDK